MKKFATLVLLLMSTGSMAALPTDDWETLRKARVIIQEPLFARQLGGIFNACVDGDRFRSISPVVHCTEWTVEKVGGGEGMVFEDHICVKTETRDVTFDRRSTIDVCLEYGKGEAYAGCEKFGKVEVLYPVTHQLAVAALGGQIYGLPLFYKEYTIPACVK